METKFSQYWQTALLTFSLAATLDPWSKLVGLETLFAGINNNMNQININDVSTIRNALEQLYLEYATEMGRSETPSTSMGLPRTHNGKKRSFWYYEEYSRK